MKVKFSLKNSPDDTILIPADLDYTSNHAAGAFLFSIDKGGKQGHVAGGMNGDHVEALLLIDKMHDVIDEIVKSDPKLTFAYLKLLEHRINKMEGHEDEVLPEDEVLKVQLDMNGIREQLKKDREEGSDAE